MTRIRSRFLTSWTKQGLTIENTPETACYIKTIPDTGEKTEMNDFIKKKAVIVKDEHGMPNYMTMFYLEPLLSTGQGAGFKTPEMFIVNGKAVCAVLISQYTNVMINGIPASLPYQQPAETVNCINAARLCRDKGKGWHLMTNTEWVYLMEEAGRLGHKIGGNTDHGQNAENPEEKGWCYDGCTCLTGLDPLAWSHDGTKDGVFGLCGNFWEWVAGLRLHGGKIEYIKDNDAAAADYGEYSKEWAQAAVDGRELFLDVQCGKVVLTDGQIAGDYDGGHMKDLQLAGSLKEVPEIIHKLGILPRGWKTEKAGIWVDSAIEEAVPVRGSCFYNTSNGGVAALHLDCPRSNGYHDVAFRSTLYLEDWKLVTEILAGA